VFFNLSTQSTLKTFKNHISLFLKMNKKINIGISIAVLLMASGSVFGQTVIKGSSDRNSPTYVIPNSFVKPDECVVGARLALSTPEFYYANTISHTGGIFDLSLETNGSQTFLGLHSGEVNPQSPCQNAIAYANFPTGNNAHLGLDLPSGTYTVVAATKSFDPDWEYTITYSSFGDSFARVPVAGVPALILTGFVLVGVAGLFSRRRKNNNSSF